MSAPERKTTADAMAEFRYRLVAELSNPYLSPAQRKQLIREKSRLEHDVPGLGRRRLSESCIRKWLSLYRQHGKAGLEPRSRQDAGISRTLSQTESAQLLTYLETHPDLTATAVLRQLQAEGRIKSNPSSSALSRLVRSAGLDRERRLKKGQEAQSLKFDFFRPLECVQVDFMYGPKVPDAKGNQRQVLLLAFLDDATRRVLYATFSFGESSVCFEAGIRHILSAHGRIGRLYTDNGSSFVSTQTQRILDTLGIILVHSRPYRPQGRGKVERFFRTARAQFFRLHPADTFESLQDLDLKFHTWLEAEYHRSPHRGLNGKTPLEAWVERAGQIIPIEATVNLEEVFFHEATRKVHRDSTLTLEGVLYEVPSTLIAERVLLRYTPHLPAERRRLFVYLDGEPVGEARRVDSYANARVRRGQVTGTVEIQDLDPAAAGTPSTDERRPTEVSLSASRVELSEPPQPVEKEEAR